jgi:phosphonate transport system substrate-binding protein
MMERAELLAVSGPGGQPRRRVGRALRFVTFLAPNLRWFYAFLARHVGDRLGVATELAVGASYDELHDADVAFVCGLPYVELGRRGQSPVEPVAAPVLHGTRYGGRPVYFSDVVVHRDSPFRSFADLRGRSWAFNEPHSQSGYGITRHHLLRRGETGGYFGRVVEAGWHERALRLVCTGAVDAAAIDSHVLTVALRDEPDLEARLRVVEVLGPSTIQPVVAARRLPADLRDGLRRALVDLADEPAAWPYLERALVRRFVPADDSSYDDIRAMLDVAEAAEFLVLR